VEIGYNYQDFKKYKQIKELENIEIEIPKEEVCKKKSFIVDENTL
jgi:hypothetical protein